MQSEEISLKGRELIDYLYETDEEGRFVRLVIPRSEVNEELINKLFPDLQGDLSFIGKKKLELSLDEVVIVKQYATKLAMEDKNEWII